MRRRPGTGLAELLVALALGAVILAVASRTLLQHVRLHREREAQSQADAVVRDVLAVLRGALAHAAPDLRLRGDTGVDVASTRIVAAACELSATRLVFSASQAWWSPPRAGDSLAVLDTLTGDEWHGEVSATSTQRASASCPQGGIRLTLASPPPPSVPALRLPVRVWRVARYVAYRSGDGTWWLGERSCAAVCGSAQPIAGPLVPPAQGGLRLTLQPSAAGRPRALDVSVRAVSGGRATARSARLPIGAMP